jgi:hypothetical protein
VFPAKRPVEHRRTAAHDFAEIANHVADAIADDLSVIRIPGANHVDYGGNAP